MKKLKGRTRNIFRFIFLCTLLLGSFSYAMFQGGFVSWFLFGSFLPLACYSVILLFYPLFDLSVHREFKQKEFNAGEKVEVTLKVTRRNRFPLFFLLVEDEVSENLKRKTNVPFKFLLFPIFSKQLTYRYVIDKMPRGEYFFYGIKVKVGDLFGFVQKEISFPEEDYVLVYPSYIEMVYEPFENQFEQGMTATKDKVQRDSTMAISIRQYVPGDRFSWINWKATARNNDIMTKEFEQRQTHDVLLILDRTPHEQFDIAVSFAASIIRSVLKKGAEIGLFSAGDKKEFFPVQRGEFQQRTLFYHLASVEDNATLEFYKIIESENIFQNQNRVLMFIVNTLHQATVEKISAISLKKGQVILFVVKGKNEKISAQELELIETAKRRGVITKSIYDGEFKNAFGREEW
ncbi:DUF58 domain-containing protein [Caldibacillus lycopersici]|uniref:DUF58 domain-containing protein n=1 Tax=Perspicuibacillus lycopersici TaxID=1325689 RepID=A0AAE3LU56_9BACI|nr:DUF58 domain-containing protein [Perspicuibacillus lycopersici]MCU9615343.1 DUF58 domain-containing protein [Perspicuibacillus lycopersici]